MVSIITVSYYSNHLLENLYKSINRTIPYFNELIIVNNAQEEISISCLDRVIVINNRDNKGYGGAINIGIKRAQSDFCLIINPDIEIVKFFKKVQLKTLPSKFLCSGKVNGKYIINFKPNIVNTIIKFSVQKVTDKLNIFYNFLFCKIYTDIRTDKIACDWIVGDFIFTSMSTLESIGGFNEEYFLFYEENDLCNRAIKNDTKIFLSREINYLRIDGKASSINVSGIKIKEEIKSLKLYFKSSTLWNFYIIYLVLFIIFLFYSIIFFLISPFSSNIKIKAKEYNFRLKSLLS